MAAAAALLVVALLTVSAVKADTGLLPEPGFSQHTYSRQLDRARPYRRRLVEYGSARSLFGVYLPPGIYEPPMPPMTTDSPSPSGLGSPSPPGAYPPPPAFFDPPQPEEHHSPPPFPPEQEEQSPSPADQSPTLPMPPSPEFEQSPPSSSSPSLFQEPPTPPAPTQSPAASPSPTAQSPSVASPSPEQEQGSPVPSPSPSPLSPSPSPREGGDESPAPSPSPSPSPSASPSPSPSTSPSPSASPSPSPSPAPREGGDEMSPSPSPSPSASPSPQPTQPSPSPTPQVPPPSPTGDTEATCSGYAYDGYLSNCELNFVGIASEDVVKTVTVVDGRFATGLTVSALGAGYLTPAPASTPLTAAPAGQAVPYCYDIMTRLPEILPLATPRPTDCSKPVVVDIASTLLQYAIKYGVKDAEDTPLTEAILKRAFNLSSSIVIGQFNAIEASRSSDAAMQATGLQALKAQAALRSTLHTVARSYTKKDTKFVEVSKKIFQTLAQHIMDTRQSRVRTNTRSLLQSEEAPLDLTSMAEIQNLLGAVQTTMQQAVADGTFDATEVEQTVQPAILQAISQAIAVINTIAQTSTSYEDVQRATQVALTTLSADVQEMLATGDVAAFTARTSEASLRSAVTAATLAGSVQAPASEEDGGSSNKAALIGGLVGGLGGGLLLIAAVTGFCIYRRRRMAAAAAATASPAMNNGFGPADPNAPVNAVLSAGATGATSVAKP